MAAASLAKHLVKEPALMIVQCPSCHTRFSIESGALEGIESPRFHCSRCDHVFGFDSVPSPAAQPTQRAGTPQPAIIDDFSASYPQDPDLHSPLEAPIGVEPPPSHAVPQYSLTETGFPLQEPPQPSGPPGRSLSIPRRFEQSFTPRAPHEQEAASAQASFDFRDNTPLKEGGLRSPQAPLTSGFADALRNALNQPLNLLFGVPIALNLLLGVIAFMLTLPAVHSSSTVTMLIPEGPRAAPQGLYISRSAFKRVTLDSGETVPVVEGTITNRSSEILRDAQIEALLFGASGEVLARERAGVGASLVRTRIESLSIEMIKELQNRKRSRKLDTLKPGEKRDFALAVLAPESSTARYFGTRIYSVRTGTP